MAASAKRPPKLPKFSLKNFKKNYFCILKLRNSWFKINAQAFKIQKFERVKIFG